MHSPCNSICRRTRRRGPGAVQCWGRARPGRRTAQRRRAGAARRGQRRSRGSRWAALETLPPALYTSRSLSGALKRLLRQWASRLEQSCPHVGREVMRLASGPRRGSCTRNDLLGQGQIRVKCHGAGAAVGQPGAVVENAKSSAVGFNGRRGRALSATAAPVRQEESRVDHRAPLHCQRSVTLCSCRTCQASCVLAIVRAARAVARPSQDLADAAPQTRHKP